MSSLPSEVKIGPPPATEITGALKALEYARTIAVVDQSGYEVASVELQSIKARHRRIEEARVRLKAPILEAGRQIDAFFNTALEPLEQAETLVKATMLGYYETEKKKEEEAKQKAAEEARRAREEGERKAREERAKAEAEARRQREEAQRLAAEADRQEREARAARERGDREAQARAERERREAEERQRAALARAEKAESKGEEKANAAMAAAAEVAARPPEVTERPQAKGVSVPSTWKHRVKDLMKLVQAVAAGTTPLSAITANDKALGQAAKSLKGELEKFYPGVEPIEEKGISSRAA